MFVKIELLTGPNKANPRKKDMDKNIDALDRAISGKKKANDDHLLLDTKSILEGIKRELPE